MILSCKNTQSEKSIAQISHVRYLMDICFFMNRPAMSVRCQGTVRYRLSFRSIVGINGLGIFNVVLELAYQTGGLYNFIIWMFPKYRGTPKMDGENNGKNPIFLMDDFGGTPLFFGNTQIWITTNNHNALHIQIHTVYLHITIHNSLLASP